jgi:5-oxoprolinase (ATP-hydrolysing) subunit A
MRRIDLNCDLGESYGAWTMGQDEQVLAHVSSANIACGFHAGDPDTMRRTVQLAAARGVAIGAHPSLPDLQGFGRREMAVSADEAYALVLYQIGALSAFVKSARSRLHHVKPHGALYNMAARDAALAAAIAAAVADFDRDLILVGLAGGALLGAGRAAGLAVAAEAFCDRRYRADGSLTPRRETGAVIHDLDAAVAQGLSIALHGAATAGDGSRVAIAADTLCIHGDKPDAAAFAQRLRAALAEAGVEVRALGAAA